MPRRQRSQPNVARALGMLESVFSQRIVDELMDLSHSVIRRANQKHQKTGLYSKRTPRG